jgi:hypothetical protein
VICEKCGGRGYSYDTRCLKEACDHRIKEVVSTDKEGKPLESAPVMECPKRPCRCRAGKPYRDALRKRIDNQNFVMALMDEQEGS